MNRNIESPSAELFFRCSPQIPSTARIRTATSTLFLIDGMTFGTWAALIPEFQHRFALGAAHLGFVLFGLVVGALLSMPFAGRAIERFGSRHVAFVAALTFTTSLASLAVAPAVPWLIAAAVVFGACKGALDVSVNALAITSEKAIGKPVLSSFQGFWSLGGLGAAFLLSLAMQQGLPATPLMLLMAGILFALTFSTLGGLTPDPASTKSADRERTRPSGRPLLLGALAFLALFSEGVLLDWSAVYARSVAGVSLTVAPLAFATFALCMAGGRFLGDVLVARLGPPAVLRISGGLAAAGVALAVLAPVWPAVIAGFALVGLGIANLVPVIMGAAARLDRDRVGSSIATVSTIGYIGFLCGPPAIGFMASAAGLPVAFCSVIIFGIAIATIGVIAIRTNHQPKEEA